MSGASNLRKVLLFGLLGALGCLAGWLVGELFLLLTLPASKEAGGSLASKPKLPELAKQTALAPPPAAALPAALSLNQGQSEAPAAVPPPPLVIASSGLAPPAAAPTLTGGTSTLAPPAPPPPALPVGTPKAPPPPPPEFAQRLEKAGGKSGDVQITLIWFNGNDLDLHCVDPAGEEIFFAHRTSRSGGQLDVDMNAAGAMTTRPVENIYWPQGKAPAGKYKVYVNHYANHGGRDPTEYKVSVLNGGRRQEFTGKISRGQAKRLICEFEAKPGAPELRLAVSPELVINQGGKNALKVVVARPNAKAAVTARLEGDLKGLTPQQFTIAVGETEAAFEIAADRLATLGERVIAVKASAGALKADAKFKLTVKESASEFRLAVSPELIVHQGGKNQLKVRIARGNAQGPVTARLEGDLRGLTPPQFTIPADETEAIVEMAAETSALAGERALSVKASAGALKADAGFRLTIKEIQPELRVAVSPEVIVHQGGKNQLKVRLARANVPGPVRCRFDGDLRGISPREFSIPAGETEASVVIAGDVAAPLGARILEVLASAGTIKADASFRLTVKESGAPELQVAVSAEVIVHQGGSNRLGIRVAWSNVSAPARLRLDGDLEGISPREFSLGASQTETTAEIQAAPAARTGQRTLAVIASAGAVEARTEFRLAIREAPPALRLALPGEMQVAQRGQNQLPVRIGRDRFTGPVTFKLEGDVAGLSPQEFTISADRSEDEVTVTVGDAVAGTRLIHVSATGPGRVRTDDTFDLIVVDPEAGAGPHWSWWLILVIGLWTALLALGLSLALVMGQNWYLARPLLSPGEFAVLAAGSLVAGVAAGGGGQALYGLLTQIRLVPEIGFLAGWLLLGGLLGRGVVFFVPNLSPWRAAAAGGCGGLLGTAAFIVVSFIGDLPGRLMGAAILGFALGLMVALVETAFRKVWLEVVYGPRDIRAVNLGSTPVVIGGDGRKCTILVAGAPGKALKFWEDAGQIYCLDIVAENTYRVSPGYRHRLKQAEVVVCSNDGTQRGHALQPPHKRPATAPVIPQTRRAAEPPAPKPVNPPPPKPAASAKVSRPATGPTARAATPVPQPQTTRQAPAPATPAAPATDRCPVCGDTAQGAPGQRRCANCSTRF